MNPWMWILWSVVALIVLFVASATYAAVREQMGKTMTQCPRCGLKATDAGKVGKAGGWRKVEMN